MPKPAAKAKAPRRKPLVIKHNDETMNVDDELLTIFADGAPITLADIVRDLDEARTQHADLLASDLKADLVSLPDSKRAQGISLCEM